jgi:hypothetical protein
MFSIISQVNYLVDCVIQFVSNTVILGNHGPQKRGQLIPTHPDAPVLLTIETHSIIGTGELVHGTTAKGQTVKSAMLSTVRDHPF